ncbi:MAG: hypothetical protein AB7S26_31225 [Sandaracinaceae bacterium]
MGEVIRKDAAAADIIADVRATLTSATARGGEWASAATERLGAVATLADGVSTRWTEANAAAAPAEAALALADEQADKLLGRVSDDIWNAVGRPGSDPALDILFPGGISYYAQGAVDEQPARMQLLAELLEGGVHPRLEASRAAALAAEVRGAATELESRVDAARPLIARRRLTERMQTSIARTAQVALSRLKAQWKADGKTEAEIHAVIPDRPSRRTRRDTDPTPPA